jgi:hypothetical protein
MADEAFSGRLLNPVKASIFSIEAETVLKASALIAETPKVAREIILRNLILRVDFTSAF